MESNGDPSIQPKPVIGQTIENLAAPGIPNIKRATNLYRKCFWILALLCGLCVFTFHCYASIDKYFDHDVTVNMDIEWHPVVSFPAVTICNLNPVKMSVLDKFVDLHDKLGSLSSMLPNWNGHHHIEDSLAMLANLTGRISERLSAQRGVTRQNSSRSKITQVCLI